MMAPHAITCSLFYPALHLVHYLWVKKNCDWITQMGICHLNQLHFRLMYILMWRPYELHFLVWSLLVTVKFSSTGFLFVFCAPVVCEICGSHTKVAADSGLLNCYTMSLSKQLPTFWRIIIDCLTHKIRDYNLWNYWEILLTQQPTRLSSSPYNL